MRNSVLIVKIVILWVTKLIHNNIPIYAVLDKDAIKNETLPHLSVVKRSFISQSSLLEILNIIFYKLKRGCLWEDLPVDSLFRDKVLTYGAVFHRYNDWNKKGEWKSLRLHLLDKHRTKFDMLSVDFDGIYGSHAWWGGCCYQVRKKHKTTNALYFKYRQGILDIMFSPKSAEHYYTYDIENVIMSIMHDLGITNIRVDGLFLNANAGFDSTALRSVYRSQGVVANIFISKRSGTTSNKIVDDLLYAQGYSIERTNVWMDSYKAILNRFETTVRNWESWNHVAFIVILISKCLKK